MAPKANVIQRILECGIDITSRGALKRALEIIGIKPDNVDRLYIELKNSVYKNDFQKVDPKDTIVFVPHCLSVIDCQAKITKMGYYCKMCGKCKICQIKKNLEPLGYRVFIVPGGSMVFNIIKEIKPKAILGVACSKELLLSLKHEKEMGIPMQGIELLKNGCFETDVDVDEVIDMANDKS